MPLVKDEIVQDLDLGQRFQMEYQLLHQQLLLVYLLEAVTNSGFQLKTLLVPRSLHLPHLLFRLYLQPQLSLELPRVMNKSQLHGAPHRI